MDPVDCAVDSPACSFSASTQPFTPKTSGSMLSITPDELAACGKTSSCTLSPDAPEFVPKNFIPTSKVLSLDYVKCYCLILIQCGFSSDRSTDAFFSDLL